MDVINSLPDEILINILSFLSTKEAVQTCILSKKWRSPWSFLPVLKFDITDWVDDEKELEECENKFATFLNGVLDNRGLSLLEQFEYKNVFPEYQSDVSLKFLDRVALLKPRVVCIDVRRVNELDFPELMFSCSSLEKLLLTIITKDVTRISPAAVNLPALKVLELEGVTLSDDDGFVQKIFSGCPALENLALLNCYSDISELSSDSLKELTIYECFLSRRVRVSCPNLVSLIIDYFGDREIPGFEWKHMRSLEYAFIRMVLEEDAGNMNNMQLLSGLSNVSSLQLRFWYPRFTVNFENEIPQCQTFNNLKTLELTYEDLTSDMASMVCFLKHSPCLESLTLFAVYSLDTEEQNQGELSDVVPFQREYLETVRIQNPMICPSTTGRVISKLYTHIKTIRNLIIVNDEE